MGFFKFFGLVRGPRFVKEPVYNRTIFNSTFKVQLYGFFLCLSCAICPFSVKNTVGNGIFRGKKGGWGGPPPTEPKVCLNYRKKKGGLKGGWGIPPNLPRNSVAAVSRRMAGAAAYHTPTCTSHTRPLPRRPVWNETRTSSKRSLAVMNIVARRLSLFLPPLPGASSCRPSSLVFISSLILPPPHVIRSL